MKKLFLTILLAIMTSLTIYFGVFWQPKEYVNEPLEVKLQKFSADFLQITQLMKSAPLSP